jgi:hypothetical protein
VFILNVLKVVCFDILLQVLILKVLTRTGRVFNERRREAASGGGRAGAKRALQKKKRGNFKELSRRLGRKFLQAKLYT